LSFQGRLNKAIKVYRKGSVGADVEGWVLVGAFVGRFSPISPADIQASAMMIDFNPTHKLYTRVIDLKQGDKVERVEDSQEFQVNRVMKDSQDHHLESWVSEVS